MHNIEIVLIKLIRKMCVCVCVCFLVDVGSNKSLGCGNDRV